MTVVEPYEFVSLRWRPAAGRSRFVALSIDEREAQLLTDGWRYQRTARVELCGRPLVVEAVQPNRPVPPEIVVLDDRTKTAVAHLVRHRRNRRGVAGVLQLPGYGAVEWRAPDRLYAEYGFARADRSLVLFAHDGAAVASIDEYVRTADGIPVLHLLLCLGWFLLLLLHADDGPGRFPYGPVPQAVPPRRPHSATSR